MQLDEKGLEEAWVAWDENRKDFGDVPLAAAITAYLAATRQEDGWQPIETAPRDGTQVLLFAPGWRAPSTGWTFDGDCYWQDCPFHHGGDTSYLPTHWRPLPSPPEGGN